MKIRSIFAISVIFLTINLSARPVRPGVFTFTQPDGSSFPAICIGDEFIRINTTTQGHAIVKDENGWWCYAIYNPDGSRYSSGHRVGDKVPSEVLSASLDIPKAVIAGNAAGRRAPFHLENENILKRVKKTQGTQILSENVTKKHGLVILAQYSDVRFEYGRQNFVDMLTKQGYSTNGATGSAKDYFDNQFNGMFEFEFEVSEIVTLESRRAYYGQNDRYGNDLRPAEMVVEACRLAHEKGVDFSKYDDDSDGYVDNVFVMFAGEDEADNPDKYADCIWSHSWYVKSGAGINLELDGKKIDQYACTSEIMAGGLMAGIGTFCHEFSHTLGLPDFYDTDYEETGGWAAGLWNSTSLMDGGNQNNWYNTPPYFNAIEREIIGLSEPIIIESNGSYTLEPIHKSGQYYKIPAENPTEYYLLECRSNEGWDKYIGGSGMLVYHVDKNKNSVWQQNTVNTNPKHQYADLIEADGRNDALSGNNYASAMQNIKGIFFPYSSVTSLTPESDPGIKFWYGSKATASINAIERKGDNITFNVSGFKGETPPAAENLKVETFMDAAILNFESDREYEGEATVRLERNGIIVSETNVSPYETGRYSITFNGLIPGNKTYKAYVSFMLDGTEGTMKSIMFLTTKASPVEWPYIFTGKNKANDDGTFTSGTKIALMVYNAADAEDIRWTFNGKDITSEGDGYFTLQESGILKAYIYWKDGSQDIIEKKINISNAE